MTSSTVEPSSPRPLYLQLADDLRRQIELGNLKAGDKIVPEVELAQKHSLARGTVRQALQLLVQQGFLERTPRKGTFVAHKTGAITSLISIVVPYLRDALIHGIMNGVESALRQNGYGLIVGHSDGRLEIELEHVRRLQRAGAGGLILFPLALPGEANLLAKTLPARFPLVLIDRTLPGLAASSVLADNYGGAYAAVEHLIGLGHRRIACVTHEGQISSVDDRVTGYACAMRAAGLAYMAPVALQWREPSREGQPPDYSDQDMAPINRLMHGTQAPTAVFCINDFIALGLLRHFHRRGLRVPEQVAVVGFDDIPLAPFIPVPLTTVAQPKFEIGVEAVRLLLDQITGQATASRSVVLPTALAVRASSGKHLPPGAAGAVPERGLAAAVPAALS